MPTTTIEKTPLRSARDRKGLTALQLARAAGISENRIYQIERGRFNPRKSEARRLAKILNVDLLELFPEYETFRGAVA